MVKVKNIDKEILDPVISNIYIYISKSLKRKQHKRSSKGSWKIYTVKTWHDFKNFSISDDVYVVDQDGRNQGLGKSVIVVSKFSVSSSCFWGEEGDKGRSHTQAPNRPSTQG